MSSYVLLTENAMRKRILVVLSEQISNVDAPIEMVGFYCVGVALDIESQLIQLNRIEVDVVGNRRVAADAQEASAGAVW